MANKIWSTITILRCHSMAQAYALWSIDDSNALIANNELSAHIELPLPMDFCAAATPPDDINQPFPCSYA